MADQVPAGFGKATPGSISDLKEMEKHVQALIKKLSPAVVAIEVGNGTGSGVVISTNGIVLTAGHVADSEGMQVTVTFPDGKTAHGKTLRLATESDAGLIKITDSGSWPHAELSDPKKENGRPGDWVLALGHPGGFDLKRSLVARLGRIIRRNSEILQTDCTISPGDSGGPLFDMNGKVIAIHDAISFSMAENFHVPVTSFADDLNGISLTADKKKP